MKTISVSDKFVQDKEEKFHMLPNGAAKEWKNRKISSCIGYDGCARTLVWGTEKCMNEIRFL